MAGQRTNAMVKRIPWVRVLAEGVVIVVSILVAFWIDAAWASRQQRAEEFEILLGLDAEFSQQVDALQNLSDRYDRLVEDGRWLLNDATGEDPVVEIDDAMLSIVYAGTLDPGGGAREALISSGKLDVLRNRELRDLIAAWQSVLDEVRDNEIGMREFVFREMVPYLASVGVEAGRSVLEEEDGVRLLDFEAARPAYARMLDDPEFRSLAQFRINWLLGSQVEFRAAVLAARHIHELIRAELETR